VLGLTATPFRNGKGYIYGKGKFYPRVSYEKDIRWGVEQGFLVEPKLKAGGKSEFDTSKVGIKMGDFDVGSLGELAANSDKVHEQVTDALDRIEGRKCIVWSCVNIEHADMVAKKINELDFFPALSYHSQTEARYEQLDLFKRGAFRHLTFVNTVSEGFDVPKIDTIVLMRPTRSPVLAIQQIGRTLRPCGDKTDSLILDYGQVIKNIGPIDKPIVRESTKRDKKQDAMVAAQLKTCPGCLSYVPSATRECPDCGHDFFVDVLKNVNHRPDYESKLFSSESGSRIKWETVGDVSAEYKPSKGGNMMIAVHFKKTIFDGPWGGYRDHIVFQSWNRQKALEKIAAYSGPVFSDWSFEKPELCVRAINNSDVSAILVDETGKWPKVLRVRKADGREIFVG
jgi:superfamily II DNA or RNA helicase